jgi:hypothetical protein
VTWEEYSKERQKIYDDERRLERDYMAAKVVLSDRMTQLEAFKPKELSGPKIS